MSKKQTGFRFPIWMIEKMKTRRWGLGPLRISFNPHGSKNTCPRRNN